MDIRRSGRAKTVLVSGNGEAAQAVCTNVVAILSENGPDRLGFTGSVRIDPKTQKHVTETILPFLDRLLENLCVAKKNYEISAANQGFASVHEIPLHISGFSADLPIFLAMLSASLDIPVAPDLASTGHFSSPDGDIAMVSQLPEKMEAAAKEPTIERFVFPSLETDVSLDVLSPIEKDRIEAAVCRWKGEMRLVAVRDAGDLLEAVLNDRFLPLAGLRQGFFFRSTPSRADSNPLEKAVRHFLRDNEQRFWSALEESLFAKRVTEAKDLLSERIQFQIRSRSYPEEIGLRLLQLMRSIPLHLLDSLSPYPLLPTADCIAISQYATERDHEDVKHLYDATLGAFRNVLPQIETSDPDIAVSPEDLAEITLNQLLSQIAPKSLSQNIGIPIDAARASFVLPSVTTPSEEEFLRTVNSFFLHIHRHYGNVLHASPDGVADKALNLLEEAFSRQGGYKAALAEAMEGLQGGMVYVLDQMTEQLKQKETRDRIKRLLKQYLSPKDPLRKKAVTEAFLRRITPQLAPEVQGKETARCAHHIEDLVWTYVQSMESLKNLFRRI